MKPKESQAMTAMLSVCLLSVLLISPAWALDYPIQPVPFTDVKVTDNFWAPRIKRNHDVTIPIALEQCYTTGRVDNFLKAAHLKEGKFGTEYPFDDTDIYKIIEGASYTLQMFPDEKLAAEVDKLIGYLGKAQESDGYLYTARTIDPEHPHQWSGPQRWVKEEDLSHELYNCGHLYEAAVAHFQATGKRSLLDIAIKNADLLCRDFGPGKLSYFSGHQIVEMGLVKMYRATGKQEYLDLAKFFLDARHGGKTYNQSQQPVTEQTEAVGHAVRATYMYSGMADIAALTGDQAYLRAIDAIWDNVVYRKLYLTGGIGAIGRYEGFGGSYVLPNDSSYNETCAAIGNVYWNYRLFLLHGQAKYYDVLERTLYNGLISGVSLSGDRFFYPNPLESKGKYGRSAWFGCACCPSNLCRFMSSVSGYIYATSVGRLYVNLYVQSVAHLKFGGREIEFEQRTNNPWDGEIDCTVNPQTRGEFEVAMRIPGWAQNQPVPTDLYAFATSNSSPVELTVNGKKADAVMRDGYAIVKRAWAKGDHIHLSLPMPVRVVTANAKVTADRDRIALQRGPLVYCAEGADYTDKRVLDLQLESSADFRAEFRPDLLGGVEVIRGKATTTNSSARTDFLAIPYFAWANRGTNEMAVWFPVTVETSKPANP